MKLRKTFLFRGLVSAVVAGSFFTACAQADQMYEADTQGSSSEVKRVFGSKKSTSSEAKVSQMQQSDSSVDSANMQKPYLIPEALKATVFADSVQYKGFYLDKDSTPSINSGVSILVDFEGYGFEKQALKDIATIEDAKKYIDDNLKTYTENGIEVREMKIFYGQNDRVFFWVGDLSFDTLASAKSFAAGIDKPALEAQIIKTEEIKKQRELEEEESSHKVEKRIIETLDTIKPPLTPEYQSYGDTTVHTEGADKISGWWEHKIAFKGYEVFDTGRTLDPFITFTPSLSSDSTPWDNKLVVGIGLEFRPWKDDARFDKLYNSWITSLSTYVSYLHREPLKDDYNAATNDKRVGIGLYRDYNILNNADIPETWKSHFWGDLWGDASYRSTNFGSDPSNFDSWGLSVAATFGFYVPKAFIDANIMPYTLLSVSTIDRGDFWSNTLKGGVGIRVTPFRNEKYKAYEWLYGLKVFAEYTDVIEYLKDDPEPGTRSSDVRIGIGYSHNRH